MDLERYTRLGEPEAFGGINAVERYQPRVRRRQVLEGLAEVDAYSRRRETKRARVYNPTYVRAKRAMFQADLLNVAHLAEFNEGVNHVLFVIDCFTKKVWGRPLKNKDAESTLAALRSIFEEAGKPVKFVSDRGGEFRNEITTEYLSAQNVRHVYPSNHASIVERFNRTFQDLLYKFLTHTERREWVSALDDLLATYNNRVHRTIKHTPNEAEREENHAAVLANLQVYYGRVAERARGLKPKFKVGDQVRIKIDKDKVTTAYRYRWSEGVFRIRGVDTSLPVPRYYLEEWNKTPMVGTWTADELQRHVGDVFKFDILQTKRVRGRVKHLVRWRGFGPEYDSWIDDRQVV